MVKIEKSYIFDRPNGNEILSDLFDGHTQYARGDEKTVGAYMLLDMTPKGRNETGPNFDLRDWVRHHDKYNDNGFADITPESVFGKKHDSCCHVEEQS